MRHHLVHRYFDVRPDRLWEVVAEDIEPLIAALEALVPPPHEPPG